MTTPLTLEMIQRAPKALLHDHLDGGLRPQTIIELGESVGFELPENEPELLGGWFAEKADSGSLVEYLKTFDLTIGERLALVCWDVMPSGMLRHPVLAVPPVGEAPAGVLIGAERQYELRVA